MKSVVTRRGDGIVPLSKLVVGDEILVSSDTGSLMFDVVIGFLHWSDESTKHAFIELKNDTGGVLSIHRDHLLPVNSGSYIRASEVKIGDTVSTVWIDGTLVNSSIIDIVPVSEQNGLCCPLTKSGRIIVDSVVCSCYSPPQNLINVSHNTCHTVMAPIRYTYTPATSVKNVNGVHPYAKFLMTLVSGMIFD